MMLEQLLKQSLAFRGIGRQPQADYEQPLESLDRHYGRQVHAEPHPDLDGAIEVGQPLQIFSHHDLAIFLADLLSVRSLRVRAYRQRPWNRVAQFINDLSAAVVPGKEHKTIRQKTRASGLGP